MQVLWNSIRGNLWQNMCKPAGIGVKMIYTSKRHFQRINFVISHYERRGRV
jgi:hypothetical protein